MLFFKRLIVPLFIFQVTWFLGSMQSASASPQVHDVLVIHSFHSGLSWTESVNRGIEEILLAKDRQDVELHIEYLDSLRRPGENDSQHFFRFLSEKYKDMKFAAVIGVDNVAVNFLRQYHSQLFPLTPVVYCGVTCSTDKLMPADDERSFAGICEYVDMTSTIESALHLYPDTKEIVIVNDRSEDGLIYDQIIRQSILPFSDKIDFQIWDNVSMEELVDHIRGVQAGTLVLWVNFTVDSEGTTFSFERSLGLVSAKCKVPILSMWKFYLGNGVLGGMMVDGEPQGKEVAKIVIDILMGEPVENLMGLKAPENQLIFDYTRMKRFDIPYKALPQGRIVTEEPQSVLWKYKKIGWTVLAIALVLEATVIILSVVTYKSKKAEQQLEELVDKRTLELTSANERLKGEITERKKVEEALIESEETLHKLSVNLLTVQENERRRISVELHDELGQSLAALKLQVGSIKKQLGEQTPLVLFDGCEDLRQSINIIIENVRRLSRDLSPVALDDLGIDVALEYLITNFAKLHEIDVTFNLVEITHLFCQGAQRHIYRIVQESLNNIGKHSNATKVDIRIEKKKNRIFLIVKDNGNGFNAEEFQHRKTPKSGIGLTAMAERVRILEGLLDIESEVGKGTTITVSLPV